MNNHFNVRKLNAWIVVLLIDIIMFMYVGKAYQLQLANDNVRFIAIGILCGIAVIGGFVRLVLHKSNTKIFRLFTIYIIYIISSLIFKGYTDNSSLMNCMFFPVVFLCAYSIDSTESQFDKIKKFQFTITFVFFLLYLYSKFTLTQHGSLMINSVYYLVLLLPFVYCTEKKNIRFIAIVCILIAVFISMKRTAIIATITSLVIYIVLYREQKSNNKLMSAKKLFVLIVSLLLIVTIYEYSSNVLNYDVFDKIAALEGNVYSGRDQIYKQVLTSFGELGITEMVFGNGYNSTIYTNVYGYTAHNDFLEILYDFGFIGFGLYIAIYYYLMKYTIAFRRNNYKYTAAFISSICIFFIVSMTSHLIFVPSYVAFLLLFWGGCIHNYEYSKNYKL